MELYAIVKREGSKELYLHKETITPTNEYCKKACTKRIGDKQILLNFYCWGNLSSTYSSYLPNVSDDAKIDPRIEDRKMAYAMWKQSAELFEKKKVIALSHRMGGWHSENWNFGQYVTFSIRTNFGFGSASYFDIVYKYKNLQLTSFSHFVKYQNSTYASVMRCTKEYGVFYENWEWLMNDCVAFYNALVEHDVKYIFDWINGQLNILIKGLRSFVRDDSYDFETVSRGVSKKARVTGDDYWIIRANKMAQSLEFIKNIKELPVETDGLKIGTEIVELCKEFLPRLINKIKRTITLEASLKKRLNKMKKDFEELLRQEQSFYHHRKTGIVRCIDKAIDRIDIITLVGTLYYKNGRKNRRQKQKRTWNAKVKASVSQLYYAHKDLEKAMSLLESLQKSHRAMEITRMYQKEFIKAWEEYHGE